MNNCELIMFLNALSVTLAQGKTTDELAFLSLLCSQLSNNFALLAIQPPTCPNPNTKEQTVPSSDEAILTTRI